MQKLRYEIDPHNRLIVSETGRQLPLTRFRRILDGKFTTGPNNSLIYHIKAPMYGLRPDLRAPHQLKLRGKWCLNKNHDLVLTLDKWRRQIPGDELTLQGQIVAAGANSISFSLSRRSEKGLQTKDILKLEGKWQADEHNRLTFRVKKGRGRHDTLTFDGAWEINKHHRIVYCYEKVQLLRKVRLKKTLAFKGFWNITKGNRLSYILGLNGKSAFEFSGRWKIKKNVGLLFEIECARGKVQAIIFGADAKLVKRDKVEFRLKNRLGQDLGLKLKLSRKLLKGDGQAFLKLLRSKKEASIYVGSAWRW